MCQMFTSYSCVESVLAPAVAGGIMFSGCLPIRLCPCIKNAFKEIRHIWLKCTKVKSHYDLMMAHSHECSICVHCCFVSIQGLPRSEATLEGHLCHNAVRRLLQMLLLFPLFGGCTATVLRGLTYPKIQTLNWDTTEFGGQRSGSLQGYGHNSRINAIERNKQMSQRIKWWSYDIWDPKGQGVKSTVTP